MALQAELEKQGLPTELLSGLAIEPFPYPFPATSVPRQSFGQNTNKSL